MITADYLSIETVAHLLVRDRVIVRQLNASFGKAATSIVAALKAQESPDLGDTNSGIYDFLVDALHNKARTYLTFQSDAPDEDMYSIEVMGLGGVYFVHGGEFGQFGYFDSLNAAAAGVDAFWDGVIVWPHPTAPRRRPFGPRCKDAAHPAKRKPPTTRPAARTRAPASKKAACADVMTAPALRRTNEEPDTVSRARDAERPLPSARRRLSRRASR